MRYILASFALIVLFYFPVLNESFFLIDDDRLINAPQISADIPIAHKIKLILTPGHHVDYYPIRDLSHLVDWSWGTVLNYDGLPVRLQNWLWFLLIAISTFRILRFLKVPSFVAGVALAIWILHPINAEMIAWASSRKDLLALFFFVASVDLVFRALSKFSHGDRPRGFTLGFGALLMFCASTLSKATFLLVPVLIFVFSLVLIRRAGSTAITGGLASVYRIPFVAGIASLIGILVMAIQKWQYQQVNDMYFSYSLDYRIKGILAAFGKMAASLVYFPAILIDCENWGEWADLNLGYIPIGVAALTGLGWWFWRNRHDAISTGFALVFCGTYLLTPGPNFLHRNFFSMRYLSPLFLCLLCLAAYRLRNVKLDQFSNLQKRIALGSGLAFAIAVLWESTHWHSNVDIWNKAVAQTTSKPNIQANAVVNRLFTYLDLYKWGRLSSEQTLVMKADFESLKANCLARAHGPVNRNGSLCFTFWSAASTLQARLKDLVEPTSEAELDLMYAAYFREYNLVNQLKREKRVPEDTITCEGYEKSLTKMLATSEQRALSLACECILGNTHSARDRYLRYVQAGLLRKIDISEVVSLPKIQEKRTRLYECFHDSRE